MKKAAAAAAFTLPTGCAVLWLCRDASRVSERGGGGQRQAANKQNKCVFAVRGPTNEQNNKTQSLNAKQVFLVCSFPPPWPKPKAQARHSHRPHTYIDIHTHTHTYTGHASNGSKQNNGNNWVYCCKLLYAVPRRQQQSSFDRQQNVSIIMLCIYVYVCVYKECTLIFRYIAHYSQVIGNWCDTLNQYQLD